MKIIFLLHFLFFCLVKSIDFDIWEFFDDDNLYLTIHDTSIWKLQEISLADPNPFPIYTQPDLSTGWNWAQLSGSCVTLSLTTNYCYCVNMIQDTFRRSTAPGTSSWTQMTGINAWDMKAGTNGHVWYVSTISHADGYKLYQLDTTMLISTEVSGTGAVKVAPTPNNLAWIITKTGEIKRMLSANTWETMPGKAKDIFVGSDSIPYIVSDVAVDKGFEIRKWNALENKWETLLGIAGTTLALDKNNNPYIITTDSKAYRQRGIFYDFCPICYINCATCPDDETCKVCRSTLCLPNSCVRCLPGEYPSLADGRCMSCPASCETCRDENTCEFCKAGYGLTNGKCIVCPDGKYLNGDSCSDCAGTCETCADAVTCDFCKPGYAVENGMCVTCPVGNYIQGTACLVCPENCTRCIDADNCQQCERGFGLLNGYCITCASDQHLAGSICRDCSENCLSCRSQDSCLVCKEGFALLNGSCKLCPEGTELTEGICKELKPYLTGEMIAAIVLGSMTLASSFVLLGKKVYKKWKSSRNQTEEIEENESVSFGAASERAPIEKGEYSDVSVLSLPP